MKAAQLLLTSLSVFSTRFVVGRPLQDVAGGTADAVAATTNPESSLPEHATTGRDAPNALSKRSDPGGRFPNPNTGADGKAHAWVAQPKADFTWKKQDRDTAHWLGNVSPTVVEEWGKRLCRTVGKNCYAGETRMKYDDASGKWYAHVSKLDPLYEKHHTVHVMDNDRVHKVGRPVGRRALSKRSGQAWESRWPNNNVGVDGKHHHWVAQPVADFPLKATDRETAKWLAQKHIHPPDVAKMDQRVCRALRANCYDGETRMRYDKASGQWYSQVSKLVPLYNDHSVVNVMEDGQVHKVGTPESLKKTGCGSSRCR